MTRKEMREGGREGGREGFLPEDVVDEERTQANGGDPQVRQTQKGNHRDAQTRPQDIIERVVTWVEGREGGREGGRADYMEILHFPSLPPSFPPYYTCGQPAHQHTRRGSSYHALLLSARWACVLQHPSQRVGKHEVEGSEGGH